MMERYKIKNPFWDRFLQNPVLCFMLAYLHDEEIRNTGKFREHFH